MSGPNGNGSEMIRFGESPGPEMPAFGEGVPEGAEVFGPPVAQGFVPPDAPAGVSASQKGKKGKKGEKGKKKAKGGGRKKDAGGGKKKSPKLLILAAAAAVVFLAAAAAALLILKPWEAGAPQPEAPEESETAQPAEPSAEPASAPTPAPAPTPAQEVTRGEAVEYIKSLSPSVLGLEGESMEEYGVYPGERVVLVEDIPCTEVDVYAITAAGTNDIQGRYLLTKTGPRRLFRLDTFTKQVTELPLSGGE